MVYALSFWLTQPVLPFLSKRLGADPVVFGYLQTVISLLQLVGGPIIGRLCDSKGARNALIMSQFGAALHYALLGCASNLQFLFLSQLPVVLMHCMHSAQVAISLSSSEKSRAKHLGRLSLSYGIGMIVGSFAGGSLSKLIGDAAVVLLSSACSIMMLPLDFFFLPEFKATIINPSSEASSMNLTRIISVLRISRVRNLVVLNILLGLGLGVYSKSFSQVLQMRFNLSAEDIGRFLSFGAIVSVLVNTFVVGYFAERYSDALLLKVSVISLGICFVVYSQITTMVSLMALIIPLSTMSTIVYTINSSQMSKAVAVTDTGTSIGLSHATRGLCGVVAPTIAGYLMQDLGYGFIGIFGAMTSLFALLFVIWIDARSPEKEKVK